MFDGCKVKTKKWNFNWIENDEDGDRKDAENYAGIASSRSNRRDGKSNEVFPLNRMGCTSEQPKGAGVGSDSGLCAGEVRNGG